MEPGNTSLYSLNILKNLKHYKSLFNRFFRFRSNYGLKKSLTPRYRETVAL